MMSNTSSAPSESEISKVLPEVMETILSWGAKRRAEDPQYQHLFSSFKDGGVAHAVFEAERAMSDIAMNLVEVLSANGKKVDKDLLRVILGLPLALKLVRDDVEKADGFGCCADKASLTLKTFFYDRLGMEVEAIPYQEEQQ